MAEHQPKRERLRRATLKDARQSMSDDMEDRGPAMEAPATDAAPASLSPDGTLRDKG